MVVVVDLVDDALSVGVVVADAVVVLVVDAVAIFDVVVIVDLGRGSCDKRQKG